MRYIGVVIFMLCTFGLFSQDNKKVDSLLAITKSQKADTAKIEALLGLYREFSNSNTDKALDYTTLALNLSQKIHFPKGIARSANNLALVHKNKGNFETSLKYFSIALDAANAMKDKQLMMVIGNNCAIVYKKQGNYAKAIDRYFKSMKSADELGDKKSLSAGMQNVGLLYIEQENYSSALEMMLKTLKIKKEIKDIKGEALVYNNIASCYKEQGKYDQALAFNYHSLKRGLQLNDIKLIGVVYNNIGELYIETGKLDSAFISFQQSMVCFKKMKDKEGLAKSLNNIAEYYCEMKQDNLALENLKEANYLAQIIGSQVIKRDVAKRISEVYFRKRNFEKAYQFHVIYEQLKDSLSNDKLTKQVTRAELQYKFDQEQKQKDFEQKQKDLIQKNILERQKILSAFFIMGFILMMVFAIFMYRSYKRKQQDNLMLAEQKFEIETQRNDIFAKNTEITSSIVYARRIQTAMLPDDELFAENLNDHFVLYKPKDIVSGDFYFIRRIGDFIILAAADCTGHGVPGAFMSMLGMALLNDIIPNTNLEKPNEMLDSLRRKVKEALHQTGKDMEAKDGMDIALCTINYSELKLYYSGAYNSLYLFRDGILKEFKADRMPIGIHIQEKSSFSLSEVDLVENDVFYLASDGYQDQLGGTNDRKFLVKNLKRLFTEIHNLPMTEQKNIMNATIEEWRGDGDQIDDILVMGVRI